MPPKTNTNWDLVPWTPFQSCEILDCQANRVDPPIAIAKNSRYQVSIYGRGGGAFGLGPIVHLSIKTLDRSPRHDWRDLQRIKNELVGPESEAVEMFPAESRLVDMANQYHLWCFPPGAVLPFGFSQRLVGDGDSNGAKQRPWPDGERPADCLSAEAMDAVIARAFKGGQHATE